MGLLDELFVVLLCLGAIALAIALVVFMLGAAAEAALRARESREGQA